MEKINRMFPNKSEIFVRIKNLFSMDNKPLVYQASDTLFGNYIDIEKSDLPEYNELTHRYLAESDGYAVYAVFI